MKIEILKDYKGYKKGVCNVPKSEAYDLIELGVAQLYNPKYKNRMMKSE